MELNFSFWSGYQYSYYEALLVTLEVSIISIIFATLLGVVIYWMKSTSLGWRKFRPLNIIAVCYIELMRCIPMLLLMLMVYSGSKIALGMDFTPFQAACIAIVMNSSVYIAEIIRAGIEAVDKGQMEAARSLGMTKMQAMRLIILPQAIKNILPAIGNEFVSVIKGSSMAAFIGVMELLFVAKTIQGATFLPLEPLMVAAVFYFVLTFPLGRLMVWLERRCKASDSR